MMIIFSLFFVNLTNFTINISNLWPLQRMPRMTKHVSEAGKVDYGDRVTLSPCKQTPSVDSQNASKR